MTTSTETKLQARVLRAELALAVQRAITHTAIEELKALRERARPEARNEIQAGIDRAIQAGRDKAEELNAESGGDDDDFY